MMVAQDRGRNEVSSASCRGSGYGSASTGRPPRTPAHSDDECGPQAAGPAQGTERRTEQAAGYNIASVVRAALRVKFGYENVEREVSGYYIANEVRATHAGVDVALDESIWVAFQTMPADELASKLLDYADHVRLAAFKRTPRGPKKPVPPRTKHTAKPHVSTARLLAEAGRKQ